MNIRAKGCVSFIGFYPIQQIFKNCLELQVINNLKTTISTKKLIDLPVC